MKSYHIGLGIILLLSSCGGQRNKEMDSSTLFEEGDSILIDESSRINSDTVTKVNEDTIKVRNLSFVNADELKRYLKQSPHASEYAQGIIPLIADNSLDYATRLVNNTHNGFIVVDKSRMKVIYFDRYGRERLNYGMACAKNYGTKHQKADSRTPEGFFTAAGIYDSTEWLFTDDEGVTSKVKGQFGPRFIRLKCPNTSQIGIHGTRAPWSIGHRASHGCIRITNENILELVEYVTVGMPIIVVPGRKDMAVNEHEGVDIPWIPTSLGANQPKVRESDKAELEAKDKAKEQALELEKAKLAAKDSLDRKDSLKADSAASIKNDGPEGIEVDKNNEVPETSVESSGN